MKPWSWLVRILRRLNDATCEATKQERQRRANQLTTLTPSPPDPRAARSIGKIEIVAQLPLRLGIRY